MRVYYAILLERAIWDGPASALLDVAEQAGRRRFGRLRAGYGRVDETRNGLVKLFREQPEPDENDTLVMLDADHTHPRDVIERLAATPPTLGVIGALAYRRAPNFAPLFFIRDGLYYTQMAEVPENQIIECAFVSTSAIAIRRWVFDKLEAEGYGPPFFRYTYNQGEGMNPSEDYYFARSCESAGIMHHVHTGCLIPHVTWRTVGHHDWKRYQAEHPEEFTELQDDE